MSKKLFNTIVVLLLVVGQFFAALPTGQVKAAGTVIVPEGSTTAEISDLIAANLTDTEFIFDGAYPGGVVVPEEADGLTFTLMDGTVITAGDDALGVCFWVLGDNTVIQAESVGGAKCVSTVYSQAILINWADDLTPGNTVEGLVIDGLEIYAEPWANSLGDLLYSNGIYVDTGVSDLLIVDNYIHDTESAITFMGTLIEDNIVIKGNMFLSQYGVVDNDWGHTYVDDTNYYSHDLTYNSWGYFTVDGTIYPGLIPDWGYAWPVDYDPYTHAAIDIQPDAAATIAVGDQVTFDVKGIFQNITGAEFGLLYNPAELEFVGVSEITDDFGPVPADPAVDLVYLEKAGKVWFAGSTYPAVTSPDATGETLYKVTFEALTVGEPEISIDPTSDVFAMTPGTGPSSNVYAASLDTESVIVVEPLNVTEVDLEISTAIDESYFDLAGSLSTGFTAALDPTVQWHYFDTDTITSNRLLADGSYPFYNALDEEVFTLEVSGSGTEFFLRDTYKWVVDSVTEPLRIQNTDPLGAYTFIGEVTDVLGLTDEVSLTITFTDAIVDLQATTALTSTSGTIADLTATFPAVIPPAIVDEPYQINSRMTLSGDAIPAGSTVTIMLSVNGSAPFAYVTDAPIPTSPFFVTDLFDPAATPADFDAGYGNRVEIYAITINGAGGNPLELNGEVLVESIISKDGFTTNVVLDSILLNFSIPADEAAALAFLQANTTITGNLEHLIATFPESIPQVIVDADYQINSRMTLSEALPEGSKVTIEVSADGSTWGPYVTDVTLPGTTFWVTELFDPDAIPADFDANYGGSIEHYRITVNGNPLDIDTFLKVESIISKDGFATMTVLAELADIPVIFTDDVAPEMVLVTPAVGLVTLAADETFILKVKASDPNLAELEIDHSFGGPGLEPGDPLYLPEFSVYATATPWGDDDDLAMFTAAGVTISYDADLQEWTIDFGEAITDNNFILNGVSFYLKLIDVAGNTWGSMSPPTGENTFGYTFEVTNTLDAEIESAPLYPYDPAYVYVGTRVLDDENNIYTVTYDDVDVSPHAMYDLARYLGALYYQDYSTVISIVYKGVTYLWDEDVPNTGSNWFNGPTSLVSVITADFLAGNIDPNVGVVLTVGDGWHTENVTFKFVILDTIDPVVTITGATADTEPMGGNLVDGYVLITENVPTVDHLLQITATVDAPLADVYSGLYLVDSTVTAAELQAYYAGRGGLPQDYLDYLNLAAAGTNPFVFIKNVGTALSLVDAAKHVVGETDVDMTVPDDFPAGTYTVEGVVKDAGGNETTVTLKLIVVRVLDVSEADLLYRIAPDGTYAPALGNLADGFTVELDPAVMYYNLDTDTLTTNNTLDDGLYPFYIGTTPEGFFEYWAEKGVVDGATDWQGLMWEIINGEAPMFSIEVAGTEYTLVDGLQAPEILMINGEYFTGDYTFTGSLTDIYGTSDEMTIKIAFTRANVSSVVGTVSMQGRTTRAGVWVTLSGDFGYGPYPVESINHVSDNVIFTDLGLGEYAITVVQDRYLDLTLAHGATIDLATLQEIAALELKAGDANDDNFINISDATIVGGLYGKGTIADNGDINFDNVVNIQDLALIGGNFDLQSADPNHLTMPYAYGTWMK